MNPVTELYGSDEREEGEIVDDFEEISDSSIQSPLYSGKSVSPQGILQDVSLSSISESGNEDGDRKYIGYSNRKHNKKRKKRKYSPDRKLKRRRKSEDSRLRTSRTHRKSQHKHDESDTDSEDKLNCHMLRQLKEAIRIDKSSDVHQNSLRTRLQVMLHTETHQSQGEADDLETLRALALLSNAKINVGTIDHDKVIVESDDGKNLEKDNLEYVGDDELNELRLEALKSAMLRKATERKKRKDVQNNLENCEIDKNQELQEDGVNKIYNDVDKENYCCEENKLPSNDINTVKEHIQEEISKDIISNEKNNDLDIKLVKDIDLNSNNTKNIKNNNCDKILKSKTGLVQNVTTGEEDVDIMRAMLLASMSTKITSQKVDNVKRMAGGNTNVAFPKIQKKINIFRKTKVPTVKPLIINLNNESDSDTDIVEKKGNGTHVAKDDLDDNVTKFLKQQRAVVEAKAGSNVSKSVVLDKSVVKLLPKSKQREYQILKQKLLLARKKRVRKASHKIENKSLVNKKLVKVKPHINMETNMSNRTQELKLARFHKTLDDMQTHKNGRLQMKGKYKELGPLLREVNQVSEERRQYEMEIKKLLEVLQKSRINLATSHENFTKLVKRLINEKDAIDRRPSHVVKDEAVAVNKIAKCTSTPIKPSVQDSICDISCIRNEVSSATNTVKIIDEAHTESTELKTDLVKGSNKKDFYPQENEPAHKIKRDPDNLESIYNNTDCELPVNKYVSPLDMKNRVVAVNDPMTTFCPYELFGVCKDTECKFNHCSKT